MSIGSFITFCDHFRNCSLAHFVVCCAYLFARASLSWFMDGDYILLGYATNKFYDLQGSLAAHTGGMAAVYIVKLL